MTITDAINAALNTALPASPAPVPGPAPAPGPDTRPPVSDYYCLTCSGMVNGNGCAHGRKVE